MICHFISDGQKIANKLSKQIIKLTTTIRGVLSDYYSLCIQIGGGTLSLSEFESRF